MKVFGRRTRQIISFRKNGGTDSGSMLLTEDYSITAVS